MKYLTQEWYQMYNQTKFAYGFFRATKYAARYDEALFQRLYKKREKKWVTANRWGCEDLDEASMRKTFAGRYEEMLKVVDTFPREILSQVADKRLFALGYATAENKEKTLAFAKEQRKWAELLWSQALKATAESEKNMKNPVRLNEYTIAVMDGIRKTKSGILLRFEDIPDFHVKGGKVVFQEYPVYRYLLDAEPLSPITQMIGKELEYVDGKYRLSLFLENVDGYERITAHTLIIEGSDITKIDDEREEMLFYRA